MKNNLGLIGAIALTIWSLSLAATAQQSGGQFTITQSAIASGGATDSSGGQFVLGGTIGQAVAGQPTSGASFSLHAGFWNAAPTTPTAASVTTGGRVVTADGRGIRNVRVTMTGADGEVRTAISGTFGYFRFQEVAAGETYIFSAFAKRYQFGEPTLIRAILEDTDDINFVAQ